MGYSSGNAFLNGFTGGYQIGTSMGDRWAKNESQKALEAGIKKADEERDAALAALKKKSGGTGEPIPQAGTPTQAAGAQQGGLPEQGAALQGGAQQQGAAIAQQGAGFTPQGEQAPQQPQAAQQPPQRTAISQAGVQAAPYSDSKFFLGGMSNEEWDIHNKHADAVDRVRLDQLIRSGDSEGVYNFQKEMAGRHMERAVEGVKRGNYNLQQRAYAADPKALQELANFYVGTMPGLSRMEVRGNQIIPYDNNGKPLQPMGITKDIINEALNKKMQADLLGITGNYDDYLDTNKKRADIAHTKQQIDESKADELYKQQLAFNTMARTGVLGTPGAGGAGGSGGSGSVEDKSSYFIDPDNIDASKNARFGDGVTTVQLPNGNPIGEYINGEMLPVGSRATTQREIQGELDTEYKGQGLKVFSDFDGKRPARWVVTKDTPQGRVVATYDSLKSGQPDWHPLQTGGSRPQAAQQTRAASQYTPQTNYMVDLAMGNAAQSSANYWGQYAINHYNPLPSLSSMMGGQPAYYGGQAPARPAGQPPANPPPRSAQPAPATPTPTSTPTKTEAAPEQERKAIDPDKKKSVPPITDIERKQMQHDGDYDGGEYDDGLTDIERKQKENEGEEQPLSDKVRAIAEATAKRRAEEKKAEGERKALHSSRSRAMGLRGEKDPRGNGATFKDDDELSADAEEKAKKKTNAIEPTLADRAAKRSEFFKKEQERAQAGSTAKAEEQPPADEKAKIAARADARNQFLAKEQKSGGEADKQTKASKEKASPSPVEEFLAKTYKGLKQTQANLAKRAAATPSSTKEQPKTQAVNLDKEVSKAHELAKAPKTSYREYPLPPSKGPKKPLSSEEIDAFNYGYKSAQDWAKENNREAELKHVYEKYGPEAAIEFGVNGGKLHFSKTPEGRDAEVELIRAYAESRGKMNEVNKILSMIRPDRSRSRKAINNRKGQGNASVYNALRDWYQRDLERKPVKPLRTGSVNRNGVVFEPQKTEYYRQSKEDEQLLDSFYGGNTRADAIRQQTNKLNRDLRVEGKSAIKASVNESNASLQKEWYGHKKAIHQSDLIDMANRVMKHKTYGKDGKVKPSVKEENERLLNLWFSSPSKRKE